MPSDALTTRNRSYFLTQPSRLITNILNSELVKQILEIPLIKNYMSIRGVRWLCIIGASFLIIYDFRLADDGKDGNTWSELMRIYGQRHWILPWLCGVLIGHLFHHDDNAKPLGGRLTQVEAYNLIFWFSAAIFLVGLVFYWWEMDVPIHLMTLVAIVGYWVGYYVWPIQRDEKQWNW